MTMMRCLVRQTGPAFLYSYHSLFSLACLLEAYRPDVDAMFLLGVVILEGHGEGRKNELTVHQSFLLHALHKNSGVGVAYIMAMIKIELLTPPETLG